MEDPTVLVLLNSYQRSEWASQPSLSFLCDRHRACPSASEESQRRSDDGEETCTGNTSMTAGRVNCDYTGHNIQGSDQYSWRLSADLGSFDCIYMYLRAYNNTTQRKALEEMEMPNAKRLFAHLERLLWGDRERLLLRSRSRSRSRERERSLSRRRRSRSREAERERRLSARGSRLRFPKNVKCILRLSCFGENTAQLGLN